MSIPLSAGEIVPALRAAIDRPGLRFGRREASAIFDLGVTAFRLDVFPDRLQLTEGREGSAPVVRITPEELLALVDGKVDLGLRLVRDEVHIDAADAEARVLASSVLSKLVTLLGLGPLRGTIVEETFLEMDARVSRSSIPAAQARRLYELVCASAPEHTLEIGLAHGTSALCILLALEHGKKGAHVAIDPFQAANFKGSAIANIERAGLSGRFTHLATPDYAALPDLVARGRKFDFVFIDGCHFTDYTFLDFFYADLLLTDSGMVAFDDVHLKEVDQVLEYLVERRGDSYEPLPALSTERLAVFRRRGPDTRVDRGLAQVIKRRV